jgi:hypothetical protein
MDAHTARIKGLNANTDYVVLVSATNGAGTSNFSAATLSLVPTSMQGSIALAIIMYTSVYLHRFL